jgi:hypothetical protein
MHIMQHCLQQMPAMPSGCMVVDSTCQLHLLASYGHSRLVLLFHMSSGPSYLMPLLLLLLLPLLLLLVRLL